MGRVIHQSVSCVITTRNHILLVKRSELLRHFPGYWSLPGGKPEAADTNLEMTLSRELNEELGIDANKLGDYRYLGNCLTPEFSPYRFENNVYHLEIDQEELPVIKTSDELEQFVWVFKEELKNFLAQSSILRVPMLDWFTMRALKSKVDKSNEMNEVIDFVNHYLDSKSELLKASYIPGIITYVVPSRSLPPSKHTNVLVIENWLIDPAPKELSHIDCLISEWKKQGVDSIFISHWHLDHHENISIIANKLKAKVFLSQVSRDIIEKHWGEDYFQEVEVKILSPGEFIQGSHTGEFYKVVSHEGHARGQLGLEHADGDWCFVSDVFQGVGSVVVEDMDSYMSCLENLIQTARDRSIIFIPSHGLPIGGSQVLQNIYKHRMKREEQIEGLHGKEKNPNQILKTLYPNLKEQLHKHALRNIKGHIQRILSRRKS